jgi:hypothetical protein
MTRGFTLVKVGRFRRSAARGMARAGFPACMLVAVLRLKRETARAIVEARDAPSDLWSAAQIALFRESGR